MSFEPSEEILELKASLLKEMVEFMLGDEEDAEDDEDDEDEEVDYTQDDVDSCGRILDAYFSALAAVDASATDRSEKLTACLKHAVVELNTLNSSCDGQLIETDQREVLVPLLLKAAKEAGLDANMEDDITLPWREW